MHFMKRFVVSFLLSVAYVACAPVYPYTKQQLTVDAKSAPGKALTHYIGQDDADLSVCDLDLPNAPIEDDQMKTEDFAAMVKGLKRGKVLAGTWTECADLVLRAVDLEKGATFLEQMASLYVDLVDAAQTDVEALAKMGAIKEVFVRRPPVIAFPTDARASFESSLQGMVKRETLPADAREMSRALLEVL